MEARTSFQCWGGGGGTEVVTGEASLLYPGLGLAGARQGDSHTMHLSLESLSQMQELYYSYQDCLRNAYTM